MVRTCGPHMADQYEEVLTDPENHDGEDFAYVVRALDQSGNNLGEEINKLGDYPVSASFISNMPGETAEEKLGYVGGNIQNTNTYSQLGVVLDVDPENIAVAWDIDLGTPCNPEEMQEWTDQHRGKVLKPLDLVNAAGHNEMAIEGLDPDSDIIGVFYKDMGDLENQAYALSEQLEDITGYKPPVVEIPTQERPGAQVQTVGAMGGHMQFEMADPEGSSFGQDLDHYFETTMNRGINLTWLEYRAVKDLAEMDAEKIGTEYGNKIVQRAKDAVEEEY